MKRRALIGLVAAVALAVVGTAYGATRQHPSLVHAAAANSQTFTDPTGDSGNAPDVTTVTVSNDDKGQITFAVALPNRTALSASDFVALDMDTDGNSSDGFLGADYGFGVDETGPTLFSFANANITPVTPTLPFGGSFANGVLTLTVNKADIGNPSQINFDLTASGDNVATLGEYAPDDGTWSYQVTISAGTTGPTGPTGPSGPPPVILAASKVRLSAAVHGKPFTASTVVTDTSTGIGVHGTVSCSAKLAGKTLPGGRPSVSGSGKASCTWKLPKTAKGKRLGGKISESYQGKSISRTFSTKVK